MKLFFVYIKSLHPLVQHIRGFFFLLQSCRFFMTVRVFSETPLRFFYCIFFLFFDQHCIFKGTDPNIFLKINYWFERPSALAVLYDVLKIYLLVKMHIANFLREQAWYLYTYSLSLSSYRSQFISRKRSGKYFESFVSVISADFEPSDMFKCT